MAFDNVTQYRATYEYGVKNSDAPVVAGMSVSKVSIKDMPEVYVKSQNGEGKTDSIVADKPDKFDFEVTVTGRISDLDAFRARTQSYKM